LKRDGFSVAGGMWTTTQQTSNQPAGRSKYMRQQPGKVQLVAVHSLTGGTTRWLVPAERSD